MHSNLIDIDLSNSNFWEQEIFDFHQQPLGDAGFRLPIPDFDLPLFERSRIMAVRCYNPVAKPWWKLGCYIKQVVAAPGGMSGYFTISQWKIPLYHPFSSQEQQIIFPDPTALTWQLRAAIPNWHEQTEISVWRYTGTVSTEIARQIQLIAVAQSQANTKLDEIISRIP